LHEKKLFLKYNFQICFPLKTNPSNIVGNDLMYFFLAKAKKNHCKKNFIESEKNNFVQKFFKHNSIKLVAM